MTNQFSVVLVDEDDVNVITFHEALEAIFNFANWCVWRSEEWQNIYLDNRKRRGCQLM